MRHGPRVGASHPRTGAEVARGPAQIGRGKEGDALPTEALCHGQGGRHIVASPCQRSREANVRALQEVPEEDGVLHGVLNHQRTRASDGDNKVVDVLLGADGGRARELARPTRQQGEGDALAHGVGSTTAR